MGFQTPRTKNPNRYDHVWYKRKEDGKWKCCLCGALCNKPPEFPTDPDWRAERHEKLTQEEVALCPPAKVGFQ